MAQAPALLIDDSNPQIRYICFSYSELAAKSYYNSTWTTSAVGDYCGNGWFSYTFQGTGIRVAASVLAPSTNFSVRLDDADFVPQTGQGSYISPILPDGEHTITYSLPQIISPFHLWTTWRSTVGDSLQFEFEGSSISVYGIAVNISEGSIIANYAIDNGASTPSGLPPVYHRFHPFVQLFHADLEPGTHTLALNVTQIQSNQALGVDLFTYNASFSDVSSSSSISSSKPKLNAGSKAGITVGVLAFAAIVAFLLLSYAGVEAGDRKSSFPLQTGKQTYPF
ncbi:hypothetical protein CPB84DRAFT_1786068 [Gymnopilus junonius]|uniref:Uncharacterized protein n=1 Tax=Gymnopilus junonius TaxID=109634 RepID=A0A9P5NHG2_GYMJU|nr:hypothetical protein CPB84DRAFT_1786068 [Gymnopilus junonius]